MNLAIIFLRISDCSESSSLAEAEPTAVAVFAATTAEIWSTPVFICLIASFCSDEALAIFLTRI
ncbi:MAG: hypothetical protein LUE12_00505 [Ruminococcus sp.]|nr:hypothetical protein [Ruminococcus sp.]